MPSPSNPKKRALMPSGKLRKALRAAGHHKDPVVQVGKEGVTEPLLRELDAQLLAHELVKVKVGTESPEDRFEVADRLAETAGAQVAQVLGRTVLVYRRHPEKPRYEPETAPPRPAALPAEPARAPRRPRSAPAARRSAGRPEGGGAARPSGRPSGRGAGRPTGRPSGRPAGRPGAKPARGAPRKPRR